ncbi:MAG: diamine N-acetyltransferase [Thermoanaerobacterium sp.]|nr:diamine N-acetyltransferase [Thermoanaerobacterium sp.]
MGLELKKINQDDLELIMNWRMKPEVTKYMYTDPILTMETQLMWFNQIINDNNSKYWIIKFDNAKIGLISLNNIDYKNKRCYWAYYIGDTSFRGKGIATILECNIYDYVFYILELNKLCCEVLSFNEKVISIHKKFGSEIEGVLKQHIFKNGKFYDVITMGITKDKWNNIRKNYVYENIKIE